MAKSKSYKSKSYNQKTLAKMKARDAGKSSSTIQAVGGSRATQLANANAQLANIKKMMADPSTKLTSAQSDSFSKQLGTASTELAKIPKAVAPTSPAGINTQVGETTIANVPAPVIGTESATATTRGTEAAMTERERIQQEKDKKDAEMQAQKKEEDKTLFESIFGKNGKDMTSPTEAANEAWKETGIDKADYFAEQKAGLAEIQSLKDEQAKIEAARDTQIAQTNDAMASMNFINNQTAQIERNSAPKLNELSAKINSRAAILQAQQGNFAEARSLVNDAVDAATAEAKYKMDSFAMFYEVNKDNFDNMREDYKDAYTARMDEAKTEYDAQLAEKQLIGEYMLKYPSAGLKMTDSIEDASKKIGAVSGGTVDLTADMKNYEYAVSGGYEGSFADWLDKNGTTGKLPKEVFSMGPSKDPEEAQKKFDTLEQLGMTSGDIISLQNDLNSGMTLAEIAEKSGMPTSLYLELQNNYITKFGE